jgi:hypothetical protein
MTASVTILAPPRPWSLLSTWRWYSASKNGVDSDRLIPQAGTRRLPQPSGATSSLPPTPTARGAWARPGRSVHLTRGVTSSRSWERVSRTCKAPGSTVNGERSLGTVYIMRRSEALIKSHCFLQRGERLGRGDVRLCKGAVGCYRSGRLLRLERNYTSCPPRANHNSPRVLQTVEEGSSRARFPSRGCLKVFWTERWLPRSWRR